MGKGHKLLGQHEKRSHNVFLFVFVHFILSQFEGQNRITDACHDYYYQNRMCKTISFDGANDTLSI
jgi:hypothetical protein